MSGGSDEQTIGYRYYMGLHFGMCHGPVDSLLRIDIGERQAWAGNQTTTGQLYLDEPNLFGGDEREGGIQGYLDVQMGDVSQGANDYLTAVQGAAQPAYRGLLTAVYRQGLISAMNPYIKPWAFKVRRILSGWGGNGSPWYSAKASITLDNGDVGMNPAHLTYQVLTDPEWGMGYDSGLIDDDNFRAAADTFYAEGFGLCLAWHKQGSVQSFLQVVMDHVGANVGQDRTTGKFKIIPLRTIVDTSALQLFDESNITEFESFQRPGLVETVNEIVANYVDSNTGKTATVTVQNLANVTAQGGVVSQSKDYPGLPCHSLAVRVAERDLRMASTPLAKARFKTNRSAYKLLPGNAVKVSFVKYGLVSVVMRILKIDYGSLQNGVITIEAAEDIFTLPESSYAKPQDPLWIPPDGTAVAPTTYDLVEASYRDMFVAMGAGNAGQVVETAGYAFGVALRPTGLSLNYQLHTKLSSDSNYSRTGAGDWCPTAITVGGVVAEAGPCVVTLTSGCDLRQVSAGKIANLDGEIVRVDAFDLATGVLTFSRGCVDTTPAPHAPGSRIWFYEGFAAKDVTEYVSGETVQAKFVTTTASDVLPLASAPVDSLVVAARQGRPYPPGKLRINNLAYPASITTGATSLTISWAHRDRLLQADQLLIEADNSVGPEPGVTYNLRFYHGITGQLLTSDTTSGTTYDFPISTTTVLLHCNGTNGSTTFVDEAGHTVTASGNAQISTAQSMFNGSSALFDGSGDYLTITPTVDLALHTNDITVQMFIRPSVVNVDMVLIDWRPASAQGAYPAFYIKSNGQLALFTHGIDRIAGGSLAANTWVHVAWCRVSGVSRLFVGGVQVGVSYTDTNDYGVGRLRVGAGTFDTAYYNGYLAELMVTKGLGMYQSNFTPPDAPFGAGTRLPGVTVEVESVRSGLLSWQKARHTVLIL